MIIMPSRLKSNLTRKSDGNPQPSSVFASQAETEMAALGFGAPSVDTTSNRSSANNFGREMRSLLLYSQQRKADRALSPSNLHLPGRQRLVQDGLRFLEKSKAKPKSQRSLSKIKGKLGGRTEIERTQAILGNLNNTSHYTQLDSAVARSLTKNPVNHHPLGLYTPIGVLEGENYSPPRLLTVGGYVVHLENSTEYPTTVRPTLHSVTQDVIFEIRIENCEPSQIRVERRYNSILVVGVKLDAGDDLTEVVNIFVPRDVALSRLQVSQPDNKGRISVRAP